MICTIWTALDPSSNISGTPHGDNIGLYPILHPHITGWPEKAAAMAGCMNIEWEAKQETPLWPWHTQQIHIQMQLQMQIVVQMQIEVKMQTNAMNIEWEVKRERLPDLGTHSGTPNAMLASPLQLCICVFCLKIWILQTTDTFHFVYVGTYNPSQYPIYMKRELIATLFECR